jgi:hypothetical protein
MVNILDESSISCPLQNISKELFKEDVEVVTGFDTLIY